MRPLGVVLISFVLSLPATGQSAGSSGSSSGSGGSTSSGGAAGSAASASGGSSASGSSSIAIESQAIAYDAIDRIGKQIGVTAEQESKPLLIGSPANLAAIGAFFSFKEAVAILKSSYEAKAPQSETNSLRPQALDLTGIGTTVNALASFLTVIKAQTTTTNNTFVPVDQALISAVESQIGTKAKVVSTAFPSDLQTGDNAIGSFLDAVTASRSKTIQALRKQHSDDPKYDSDGDLKDLDAQLSSLQQAVTVTASGNPSSVTLGAALLAALGAVPSADPLQNISFGAKLQYNVLTFVSDSAGGGTRTKQFFLLSLFVPWPYPTFNGGAIVSYSLKKDDGTYIRSGTYRYVSSYARWKTPKNSSRTYSNLPCDVSGKDDPACKAIASPTAQ